MCLVVHHIGIGTISQNDYLHRESGQFCLGSRSIWLTNGTFCQCYNSEYFQCLSFLLHIPKINQILIFESKGQRSNLPLTFWLHFIIDRICLHLLMLDTSGFVKRWRVMIGRHPEHERTKRLLVKVSNGCFPIKIWVFAILLNCASISAPYMWFVIKFWWTVYVLEYYHFITSIILHKYHPKVTVLCKSCNSFKSTYLSFA